jgi:hypothetical protein
MCYWEHVGKCIGNWGTYWEPSENLMGTTTKFPTQWDYVLQQLQSSRAYKKGFFFSFYEVCKLLLP